MTGQYKSRRARRVSSKAEWFFVLSVLIGCAPVEQVDSGDVWSSLPSVRLDSAYIDSSRIHINTERLSGATLHSDGSSVVADAFSKRITFIDSSGEVRRVAGGGGSGPGEFDWLNAPLPCGQHEVLFWDQGLRRASRWTVTGELVRSVVLDAAVGNASIAIGAERNCDALLFYAWDPRSRPTAGTARMRAALLRVSLDGVGVVDTVFPLEGDEMEVLTTPSGRPTHGRVLFSPSAIVAARTGMLVRAHGELPEADLFRDPSRPAERVTWTERPREASDAQVALIDASRESFRQRYPQQAPFIPSAITQSRRAALPSIDRVVIGADASVWLRRYRISDGMGVDVDPSLETWLVMPTDGRERYLVVLDRGSSLVATSREHALVQRSHEEGDRLLRVTIPSPQ